MATQTKTRTSKFYWIMGAAIAVQRMNRWGALCIMLKRTAQKFIDWTRHIFPTMPTNSIAVHAPAVQSATTLTCHVVIHCLTLMGSRSTKSHLIQFGQSMGSQEMPRTGFWATQKCTNCTLENYGIKFGFHARQRNPWKLLL